jgi:hypothetical protein
LTLAWNPNPEPNIAGYIIEYGNLPGVRPFSINVGNQTTWQFNGRLIDGMPYYFVVRAYNTSGTYSGPSIEVSRRVGIQQRHRRFPSVRRRLVRPLLINCSHCGLPVGR